MKRVEFFLEIDVLFVVQSEQGHLTVDSFKLFVEILPEADTQVSEALSRVALSILLQLLKLSEDILDRCANLVNCLSLEHRLDGDFLERIVNLTGCP